MRGEGNGRALLLVDDEPALRASLGQALRVRGFNVDEAADGNKALAKLATQTYDCVVTDIVMPDKEGIETIIEMRKRWPALFIVAMSGGGRVGPGDFLNLAAMLGADRTLAKPFRASELASMVLEGPPPTMAA